MEDLATLVREAMENKGMSVRDVERESERHGHRVSYSAVSRARKGNYVPGDEKLVGLSRALDIPIQKLRRAAGLAEPGTPFRLPEYAARLSPGERSAIEHLVRVMVEAKDQREQVMGNAEHPTPIVEEDEYDLAAREDDAGFAPDADPHTT